MDMSSMASMPSTMATAMSTGTATAASTSITAPPMNMSMGGDSCKISMLWNWYTIDACFLSSTWHIKSSGMFAGSCIGVICLVMSLEFLRRLNKEYDRYLISKRAASRSAGSINDAIDKTGDQPSPNSSTRDPHDSAVAPGSGSYMPSIMEQAIRALLHMLQFAVAYFIMLLAMYFNGYIIICIFIGAYLGAFVFHWEALGLRGPGSTSATQEATFCCG